MSPPGATAGTSSMGGFPDRGGGPWTVERVHGTVSELLAWPEPPAGSPRTARIHQIENPALVLGSTQGPEAASPSQAAAAGVEVVRRSSGGGAVLLWPGRQVWVDFFVPAADPLWDDDVSLAALWVGRLWSSVVASFVAEPAFVHSGRLVADRWGRLICFAGAGSGELFVGGLKVTGVSQRRSRHRARFQTTTRVGTGSPIDAACTTGDRLEELDLLDLTDSERAAGRDALAGRCGSIPATPAEVSKAMVHALRHPL